MSLCLCSTATLCINVHTQLWFQRTTHPSPKTLGPPTTAPFLPSMPSKKRSRSTENVLPRHGILAWNPTVQLERYRTDEPSLSGEPECLSLQEEYRTNDRKSQASPPVGAFLSSRSPERGRDSRKECS